MQKKSSVKKRNRVSSKKKGKNRLKQNAPIRKKTVSQALDGKQHTRITQQANGPPKKETSSKKKVRIQHQQAKAEQKTRLQFERKDLDGTLGEREPDKRVIKLKNGRSVSSQKQSQKKRYAEVKRKRFQRTEQKVQTDDKTKTTLAKTYQYRLYEKAQEKQKKEKVAFSGTKGSSVFAKNSAAYLIHHKLRDAERENSAVEAAHKTELAGEHTWRLHRYYQNHKGKKATRNAEIRFARRQKQTEEKTFRINLQKQYQTYFEEYPEMDRKHLQRLIQKFRIKQEYVKAYRAGKTGAAITKETLQHQNNIVIKVARKAQQIILRNSTALVGGLLLLILMLVVMTGFSSCSMFLTDSVSNVVAISYLADPKEIEQAELYYTKLEAKLQQKINEMQAAYPGHEEYRYNIGMIWHDPHVLIGYLTAKYGDFTFEQVKPELEALFEEQYGISVEETTETRKETKEIRVGESLGTVVTSGYCSCPICCGIWSGGPTASGVMPKANHTIAVDAANPFVPMGTKVVMNGIEYTVEDTGNFARYGVQFDVYYDNHSTALMHGHRSWECYLAEGNSNSVEVTRTVTVDVANISLQSKSLGMMITEKMDSEETEIYENVYGNKGNLQVYDTPIDLNWYAYVSNCYGYSISNTTGQTMLRKGVDINVQAGSDVESAMDGVVVKVGYDSNFGNYVVTQDEEGIQIKYAYLQSISVSKGDTVTKDTVIGKTGSTGSATGSQLYLELVKDGTYYNPIFYIETGEGGLYGSGIAYDNETVRRIFAEAERYLGMPYVWGGSSPATSFDCSGFVSYVFTNSGVCNMGRLTAQGIYNICTPVSPVEAQPGDIIFFTGTYNAGDPVTHVGIYAGNGQMIHCGDPIQYTSINSSYWQSHFYAYGRPN